MSEPPSKLELARIIEQLEITVDNLKAELAEEKKTTKTYQNLFDNTLYEVHIWQLIFDHQGEIDGWRLIDANPAALSSWQLDKIDKIKGKTAEEIFPGSNVTELFMPVVKKIFSEKRPFTWEEYFPGTQQTLFMISIPMDDIFISTGVDISELKNTEKHLKETLMQLTEAIRAGNVGLWEWNLETNAVHFSKEWKQQIGYDENDIIDQFDEWKSRIHPDDLHQTLEVIKSNLKNGSNSFENQFRFRHKNGSYKWILAHSSIIKDESDKPLKIVGTHIDITQQRLFETKLNDRKRLDSLGSLATGIAHDFNNLLTPILNCSELAKISLPNTATTIQYLNKIESTVLRAKELVNKILMLQKGPSHKKEQVNLLIVLNEVLMTLDNPNIEIIQSIDSSLCFTRGDETELFQVFLNIITNAIQASTNESSPIHIKVERVTSAQENSSTDRGQEFICLSVKDYGSGIPPEIIEQIYDPFFTTKHKDNRKGTGLGLSIVASIIKSHEGRIEVDSNYGSSTEFRVYLPVLEEITLLDTQQADETQIVSDSSGHIIIIDDEEDLCELGAEILTRLGYDVASFTDPIASIEYFEKNSDKVGLVISDYAMPKMDGTQLISHMKKIKPDIPIVILTGVSLLLDNNQETELQVDAVLGKPYKISEMSEIVKYVLSAH